MPALFVGHGSPMNALPDSPYAAEWREIGQRLPRPASILAISAHWETQGVAATADAHPRTIHDFRGFPQDLYGVQYPAPGAPELVERLQALLAPTAVKPDLSWGLDHGSWSVLTHLFPDADIPVVQLSLDMTRPPRGHYELARRLAPLRDDGVLILATGDIVHNLRTAKWRGDGAPYDWAVRFNERIKAALEARDHDAVVAYADDPDAALAAPDAEHFYPLLYVAAVQDPHEAVAFLTDRIDLGSVSMTSVAVGL
jgi:4,5-DOPA dioxygenase extradiol